MNITFTSTNGSPLGKGQTAGPVPSAGDSFMNGGTEYEVTDIAWQLDGGDLECFVTVKQAGSPSPMARFA